MNKNTCPYCEAYVGYMEKLKPLYSFQSQFVHCPNCNRKVSDFWIKAGLGVAMSGFGVCYFAMRASNQPYISLAIVLSICIAVFLLLPAIFGLSECDHVDAEAVRKQNIAKEMEINGRRILLLLCIGLGLLLALPWLLQR